MNINRIKKEIEHQTRNGRTDIYVSMEDLKELEEGASQTLYGKDRIYVPIDYLLELIDNYEENQKKTKTNDFKNSLKVPEGELIQIEGHKEGFYFTPNKDER